MERNAIAQALARRRGAWPTVALLVIFAGLLAGCGGGSSQSVINTGFPQGAGPFLLRTGAASGGGALALSASNVPSPVFVPAPTAVSDSDSRLTSPVSATGGALTFIKGTAYEVHKPTQPANGPFPSAVTVTFTYAPANLAGPGGAKLDVATLNIYYYDGKNWVPVRPSDGGFSYSPAGTITTTIRNFVYPNGTTGTEGSGPGYIAVFSAQPPTNPAPAA